MRIYLFSVCLWITLIGRMCGHAAGMDVHLSPTNCAEHGITIKAQPTSAGTRKFHVTVTPRIGEFPFQQIRGQLNLQSGTNRIANCDVAAFQPLQSSPAGLGAGKDETLKFSFEVSDDFLTDSVFTVTWIHPRWPSYSAWWIHLKDFKDVGDVADSYEYYHVPKFDLSYDEPIADLDQWAADNFMDGPDAEVDSWNLERFNLDIDHDGSPEVFVTSYRLPGNGGGPHFVFRKRGQAYYYAGQLSGRKDTIRVLPLGPDGHAWIRTWWSGGAGYGIAVVWKWDGEGFTELSSEEVRAGDSGTEEGNRRFKELFGE